MKELAKYHPDNSQVVYKNLFNGRDTIVELWNNPFGQFTVRAGANSEFSYTGFIPNVTEWLEFRNAIAEKYKSGKLFK